MNSIESFIPKEIAVAKSVHQVFELSEGVARDYKAQSIQAEHILYGLSAQGELNELFTYFKISPHHMRHIILHWGGIGDFEAEAIIEPSFELTICLRLSLDHINSPCNIRDSKGALIYQPQIKVLEPFHLLMGIMHDSESRARAILGYYKMDDPKEVKSVHEVYSGSLRGKATNLTRAIRALRENDKHPTQAQTLLKMLIRECSL